MGFHAQSYFQELQIIRSTMGHPTKNVLEKNLSNSYKQFWHLQYVLILKNT